MANINTKLKTMPVLNTYNHFQPNYETDLDVKNIVVLDTETTGLDSTSKDEIIQLGIAYYNPSSNKMSSYYRFVRPKWTIKSKLIKRFSTNHGKIDSSHHLKLIDKAYKSNLDMYSLAKQLARIVENKIVLIQNGINFDAHFINKLFGIYNMDIKWACLDLMPLVFRCDIVPKNNQNKTSYNQESIGYYFDIKNNNPHDAIGDCVQLYEIYQKLWTQSKQEIINNAKNYSSNSNLINRICLVDENNERCTLFLTPYADHLLKKQIKEGKIIAKEILQFINDKKGPLLVKKNAKQKNK